MPEFGSGPRLFDKKMGLTHAEFQRGLDRLFGPAAPRLADGTAIWTGEDGRRATFTLGPTGRHTIALLSLPLTPVRIALDGFDDAAAADFMRAFDRTFQKGGG
ncbi:MAG: hypothetical protein KDE22_05045 [Rhodobacterales bacterium]|nr:hypothetical protein [Rhodobacterales bacterium]